MLIHQGNMALEVLQVTTIHINQIRHITGIESTKTGANEETTDTTNTEDLNQGTMIEEPIIKGTSIEEVMIYKITVKENTVTEITDNATEVEAAEDTS